MTKAIFALAFMGVIGAQQRDAQPKDLSADLRIVNDSAVVFQDFTVLFPEDSVAFGEVRPNAATPYVRVPHGVGPYAAFTFVFNGKPARQRVMDFVTWKRLSGRAFTYHIIIPREGRPFVEIVHVTKDR